MQETKKKILLVDDEKETLAFLSATLKRNDFEVITASEGVQALELAKQTKPQVIILDIIMPGIDGAEIAVNLDDDPETRYIPIIFLTGIMNKKEQFFKIRAGKQYELLAKPVDQEELLAAINKVLK